MRFIPPPVAEIWQHPMIQAVSSRIGPGDEEKDGKKHHLRVRARRA